MQAVCVQCENYKHDIDMLTDVALNLRSHAERAFDPDIKNGFLTDAERWLHQAEEIEQKLNRHRSVLH